MNSCQKVFSVCLLTLLTQAAFAQVPDLGTASDFTLLSVGTSTATPPPVPDATAAVTTTRSTIIGDVGSAGAVSFGDASSPSVITGNVILSGVYTQVPATPPAYSGMLSSPLPVAVIADFNAAYAALAAVPCDYTLTGTLNRTLTEPGVYCFDAATTTTDGILKLVGDSNALWLFKIGTLGTGALTFTDTSVVMAGDACNVTWWVAEAATITRGAIKGTILAGAGFTATGTAGTAVEETFAGRALAKAGVTTTDMTVTGCEGGSSGGKSKSKCNQGVGNGPEDCDPGNSNQDGHGSNPFVGARNTNDELGGTPGDPGRKGGNIK